jgi:hypothetical protein
MRIQIGSSGDDRQMDHHRLGRDSACCASFLLLRCGLEIFRLKSAKLRFAASQQVQGRFRVPTASRSCSTAVRYDASAWRYASCVER